MPKRYEDYTVMIFTKQTKPECYEETAQYLTKCLKIPLLTPTLPAKFLQRCLKSRSRRSATKTTVDNAPEKEGIRRRNEYVRIYSKKP